MVEKLIYESKKSKVYFQDESEFGKPVLLKILNFLRLLKLLNSTMSMIY